MQRDREIVVVDAPQLLEDALGLAARVDEDERGLVALDQRVDLAQRVARGMAGPRQPLGGVEHGDVGRRAAFGDHQVGERRRRDAGGLRHEIAAQVVGLGDGGGEADAGELRRQREQPREPEREQIAALARHQRVQFVEHDAAQRAEQVRRIRRAEDQRKLLGRGEQDVRRIAALALALARPACRRCGSRCGSAGPSRPPALEVARDVDRQRLQRRDVERVQPALAPHVAAGGDEARLLRAARCRCSPAAPAGERECRVAGSVANPPPWIPHPQAGSESTRKRKRSTKGSVEIRRASCRRRSARSAGPSGRHALWPAVRADARAASSRGWRTSARTAPAASAVSVRSRTVTGQR